MSRRSWRRDALRCQVFRRVDLYSAGRLENPKGLIATQRVIGVNRNQNPAVMDCLFDPLSVTLRYSDQPRKRTAAAGQRSDHAAGRGAGKRRYDGACCEQRSNCWNREGGEPRDNAKDAASEYSLFRAAYDVFLDSDVFRFVCFE